MGVINHNAVLATTFDEKCAARVQKWIESEVPEGLRPLFLASKGIVNSYTTIILAPDGSKEGWDESKRGDDLRAQFIKALSVDNYEDGSSPWEWVEVGYGEFGATIDKTNTKNRY